MLDKLYKVTRNCRCGSCNWKFKKYILGWRVTAMQSFIFLFLVGLEDGRTEQHYTERYCSRMLVLRYVRGLIYTESLVKPRPRVCSPNVTTGAFHSAQVLLLLLPSGALPTTYDGNVFFSFSSLFFLLLCGPTRPFSSTTTFA